MSKACLEKAMNSLSQSTVNFIKLWNQCRQKSETFFSVAKSELNVQLKLIRLRLLDFKITAFLQDADKFLKL